ncbi:MAG: hypothetical protein GXP25_04625 [Planctomycetes bacterium]|nr:hypothetical protein [Planctomycetota bacterium]
MKQSVLAFSVLALWMASASGQAEKPMAYLMMVQKTQEGDPVYASHARGNALPGRKLAKQFEDQGFKTREVCAFSPQLTMDFLKQFNVVILGAGGEGNQHSLFSKLADDKAKLLLEYVKQGGGLLALRSPGWQFGKDIEEINNWLRPTGIEILDEQVLDEENAVNLPSGYTLFWTDNIAKHPVTEGVAGLFYPNIRGGYRRYTDFSSPVKTSSDWTVLVRGTKTAHSVHRKKGSMQHPATPGTYKTMPPLMAVRQFGQGRIAVFPIASSTLWQDGYHALWGDGLPMDGETKGMKGNGARLMKDLFAYLSEPSKGRFGGYVPKAPVVKTREDRLRPIDWDKIHVEGIQRKNLYVGLIGARSALSSGQGRPAEFIQAAKEAGYNFIAFTEDLAKLTPEKFTSLKKICEDNCSREFKAYPGFTYLDDSGNTWVTFSNTLSWPKPGWFSTKHPGRLSCNNALIRGSEMPPVVLTHSHKNPEAPWFQGNFNAFALFTYANSKLIDESLDNYLRLLRMSFRSAPVVVRFVDSPEQVTRARQDGFQTYVRWFDDNIIEAFHGFTAGHKGRPVWLRSSFVSEGPIIEDIRIVNAGTSDLARPGGDRCRMHLMVSADGGLKEVVIRDGDRKQPWRRFFPHGEKTLEQTIDFFHDHQHDFVVIVTDRNGKKAISWHNPTRVQENAFHRCSDNYNTMPRGKWWGEPGDMLNIRGFEDYLVVRNFMYCGGLILAGVDELKRPAVEYYPVLACRFGSIVDTLASRHYALEAAGNPDHTDVPFCAEKNEYIAGKTRYTFYTCRQDSSLIEQVQGNYDVLKEFTIRESVIFRANGRQGTHCVCATLPGGRFFAGQFTRTTRHFWSVLPERGYAALFPNAFNGSLAVLPLQPGLRYTSHTNEDMRYGNLYLKLPQEKTEFKQGEKIEYKYIGINGPLGGAPDNTFVVDIIDSLGLHGKTAYEIKPAVGSVAGRSFALELKADRHGFAAQVSEAHLPLDLPVRIGGLNPRWDAGILYKGKATLVIPEWIINEFGQRYVTRKKREVTNEIIRFPVLEDGTGFLQIDTEVGPKDVFIGNLLVSDNPQIHLMLVDTRPGKAAFVAHNPTDADITCRVSPAPGFTLLGEFSREVSVPAGSSVAVKIQTE